MQEQEGNEESHDVVIRQCSTIPLLGDSIDTQDNSVDINATNCSNNESSNHKATVTDPDALEIKIIDTEDPTANDYDSIIQSLGSFGSWHLFQVCMYPTFLVCLITKPTLLPF